MGHTSVTCPECGLETDSDPCMHCGHSFSTSKSMKDVHQSGKDVSRELEKLDGVAKASVNDFSESSRLMSIVVQLEAEEDTAYASRNFKKGSVRQERTGYNIEPSLSGMTRKIKNKLEELDEVTTIKSVNPPNPIYDHKRARNPTESNKKVSTGLHREDYYVVDYYVK